MKFARLKNSSGFSLIEILMAMGMAGVVGLGAAYVVQSQVLTQRDVTSRMDLSAAHSLALQKARNLQFISDYMVLAAVPDRSVGGGAQGGAQGGDQGGTSGTPSAPVEVRNVALDRCLAGKPKTGENCEGMNILSRELPPVVRDDPSGPVKSEIIATRTCGPLGCSKISVRVTTRRMMNKNAQGASFTASGYESGDMKEAGKLESIVEFPGLAFLTNEQMDFTCASGATLTGLSMGDRVGSCSPAVSAALMTCSGGNGAMLGFGLTQACTQLRSNACVGATSQAGVSKIGRAVSSVDCGDIVPLTAPPTPVPPATATPGPVQCYEAERGFGIPPQCDQATIYAPNLTSCENRIANNPSACPSSACVPVYDAAVCASQPPATATPAGAGCWSSVSYGPVGRAITGPNRCVLNGACTTIGQQSGVTKCMEVKAGATQPYTQNDIDDATLETGYRLNCRPVSENNCTVSPSAPDPGTPTPAPTATPAGTPSACGYIRISANDTMDRSNIALRSSSASRVLNLLATLMGKPTEVGACDANCETYSWMQIIPLQSGNGEGMVLSEHFGGPNPAPPSIGSFLSSPNCSTATHGTTLAGLDNNFCTCRVNVTSQWRCDCPAAAATPPPAQPPAAQACTPGITDSNRRVCCSSGNGWSMPAPVIIGQAQYRFCGCGNNPEFSRTRLPNGTNVNDGC